MPNNAILENAAVKSPERPGQTVMVCAWCEGWEELTERYLKA